MTVFFVKQTLAYLPVADWTVSFAFFFLDILSSAMVDVIMLHIILLFLCLKKKIRDCCTLPWLLQIIIFPVDINKTQPFYQI